MKKLYEADMLRLDLQLFAEAGNLVNTTAGYTNAYTGDVTNFSGQWDLSAGMKTYYNTALLEFAKEILVYAQLGKKQSLPANHGKIVEWRKFNNMPDAERLQEAVIPVGKKLGESAITVEVAQYGMYYTYSDQIDNHHVDPVVSEHVERLGHSMAVTNEKLIRNELSGNTNVMYAWVMGEDGKIESKPQTRQELKTALSAGKNANLTMKVLAHAATLLHKANAPTFDGNEFVAVTSFSAVEDLRIHDPDWTEAHKYANPETIYNGEVGKVHGIRILQSNLSPVIKGEGDAQALYQTMVFGRDAFAVVDPEGAGMEMIHKSRKEIGGPLEQFGSVGAKASWATKVLYPERIVVIEHGSTTFGDSDQDNMELKTEQTA